MSVDGNEKYYKTNSNGKEELSCGYFLVLKNKKRKEKSGNYAAIIIRRDNNIINRIINQR
jgi:hypothetical protein